MSCCYLCANWRQIDDLDKEETKETPGMCTLWPKHIESKAGNYCGQFVADGYLARHGDTPQPLQWLERLHHWREAFLKEKKEVRRLTEVNKELRRKLKEKRAK